MIADFLDWLANLPPAGVVAVAGLLVFGECTLGLGLGRAHGSLSEGLRLTNSYLRGT